MTDPMQTPNDVLKAADALADAVEAMFDEGGCSDDCEVRPGGCEDCDVRMARRALAAYREARSLTAASEMCPTPCMKTACRFHVWALPTNCGRGDEACPFRTHPERSEA